MAIVPVGASFTGVISSVAEPAFQLFAEQYRIPGCYVLLEVEGPFPTKEEAVQAGQYCMQELDRQYDKYMNDNEVSKDN